MTLTSNTGNTQEYLKSRGNICTHIELTWAADSSWGTLGLFEITYL